jgi:stalled ribosome rescue protein Dom34
MRTRAGLWIDHRKAIIVIMTDQGEETELIISHVEKQLRRSGDAPLRGPYESSQVPADNRRQRTLTGQLNRYYDAVIAYIQDAQSILICGPGEAKEELNDRLESKNLGGHVVGIETVDKMTEQQVAAKVREHFAT